MWTDPFVSVANFVLWVAALFKAPHVPGLVVTFLIACLAVIVVGFWRWARERKQAIIEALRIVKGPDRDADKADPHELAAEFFKRQPKVNQEFHAMGRGSNRTRRRIVFSWREYRDTLTNDEENEQLLNGIRPSVFFNAEDLDIEARGWRIFPSLFVSIGLAATFFGLIAALQQTSATLEAGFSAGPLVGESAGTSAALQDLLDIASAKFIMSLSGLLCSIVLTAFMRYKFGKIEDALNELCVEIEKRVAFVGLESLAFQQVQLIRAQKEHTQKLNTELIAELNRPLREELPEAISRSIRDAIAPVIDQVGQVGTENVQQMAGDLAGQFSGEIARAISEAADRFDMAAGRIESMADALRDSTSRFNGDIEQSVARLSHTMGELGERMNAGAADTRAAFETGSSELLERMNGSLLMIGDTIKAGNAEQRAASEAIGSAAAAFAGKVDAAGTAASEQVAQRGAEIGAEVARQFDGIGSSVSANIAEALQPMLTQATNMAEETGKSVVTPIRHLSAALDGFVSRVERGSKQFSVLSTSLDNGSQAAERSANAMDRASGTLVNASDPVAKLARGMTSGAQATSEAATHIAAALEQQRDVVGSTMASLTSSLSALQNVVDRYDQIDENLGEAFDQLQSKVRVVIQELSEYSGGVHDQYADALQTLKTVVENAENFEPARRSA